MSEIDANGGYSGYNYDYLNEIAQYTGWEYEFVQAPGDLDESLGAMLGMLEKGELDIMGSMNYSPELAGIYSYPGASCGMAHTALMIREDNTELNGNNYHTYPMRIAAYEKSKTVLSELEAFAQSMGMRYTLVPCPDEGSKIKAVREGRADAMLARDVNRTDGMKTLVKFSPKPFYFAVTKGKTDLLTELDAALTHINEMDPGFTVALFEKYFGNPKTVMPYSEEELEWLETSAESGTYEISCSSVTGEQRWFRVVYKKIFDAMDKPAYIAGKLIDIHQERAEKERLQSEASQDGLTGISNAAASRSQIEGMCGPGGVLFLMDVDRFKEINDQFGHYNGDMVLTGIAGVLKEVFDGTAVIGCWGGDEFVAYLPHAAGIPEAEAICVKIRDKVAGLQFQAGEISPTVSIGAALCVSADYITLYQAADGALYHSKRERRGTYHIVSC